MAIRKGTAQPRMRPVCSVCHLHYYRRNLSEQWVERNPGHRAGWKKEELRICTNCQTVKTSLRVLSMSYLRAVPSQPEKKRGHGQG